MIGTAAALGFLVGQMVYACEQQFPEAVEDAGFYAVEYVEELAEDSTEPQRLWTAYDNAFDIGYLQAESVQLTCEQFEENLAEAEKKF